MRATKKHMPKVGDVIRVKHWQLGEFKQRVVEVDIRYCMIRAEDGDVYALCNELDDKGAFFF